MSKTCTRCGETKPLDDFHRDKSGKFGRRSQCKGCARERKRRYYEENREKVLERNRRYWEENREKGLERNRRYHEENRDKMLDYKRRYYEENRDEWREYGRRYYEENRDKERERQRIYYEENRDEWREYARRYREENRDIINQGNKMRSAKYTRTSNLLASKKGTPYSPDEDAFLMAYNGMSVYQKAVELGRTYASCSARRQLLRARANH